MSKQADSKNSTVALSSSCGENSNSSSRAWTWLFGAWIVALAASLGVLFIGEVLGQEPCNLCWYQRIAMFPLAAMLGLVCLYNALPLALAGGLVTLWHTLLYMGLISEAIVPCSIDGPSCTDANMTIVGLPLPMISLASFIVITLLLT